MRALYCCTFLIISAIYSMVKGCLVEGEVDLSPEHFLHKLCMSECYFKPIHASNGLSMLGGKVLQRGMAWLCTMR